MRIFLISNMYPSSEDPLFGVFVRNFKSELEKQNAIFSKTALIRGKSNSLFKKAWRYIKHYLVCIKHYSSHDYDLIYVHYLTHHLPILWFFNSRKKTIVINSHGSDIIKLQQNTLLKIFANKILKKVDLIVVPTSYFKQKILDYYPSLNADSIFVSPSAGIESHKFYFKGNKKTSQGLSLGFISRFIEEKGWKTYLKALLSLKQKGIPFKALIAGKGPDEGKILNFIETQGLSNDIDFLGLVKQEELVNIYNDLDLYVFPTYREAESLGLTGLEAMSCGTPVISCDIAGPATYIKHQENGFLFPKKDVAALVKNILHYNGLDPRIKEEMSQNALNTAQDYESGVVSKSLLVKLTSLVEKTD